MTVIKIIAGCMVAYILVSNIESLILTQLCKLVFSSSNEAKTQRPDIILADHRESSRT